MRDLFDILDAVREDMGDSDAVLVRREDILMLAAEVERLHALTPLAGGAPDLVGGRQAGSPGAIDAYGARFVIGGATYPQKISPVVVH